MNKDENKSTFIDGSVFGNNVNDKNGHIEGNIQKNFTLW
jgi:hypothetical protein